MIFKRLEPIEKFTFSLFIKTTTVIWLSFILIIFFLSSPKVTYAKNSSNGELHAFYPSSATFNDSIKKYIDDVDSLSFAWSRIDAEDPKCINTEKGKNGNTGFYYPKDYLLPIEYAKSKGKTIQLNIYADSSDCEKLLPYGNKREDMIRAISDLIHMDITQGKGIYYDGVVIDFEGLRNTDNVNESIKFKGKYISEYFILFLNELKLELKSLDKNLYVAVNPSLYYDGYDFASILDIADRVILMAHDYEPVEKLRKDQVMQYIGYEQLDPIHSLAPFTLVKHALREMQNAASDLSDMSKVWLQIAFDSAQWQYDVKNAGEWENLDDSTLSRGGRLTPLYISIKDRVLNKDGFGQNITYGYNNELQSPYIRYYNTSDRSFNIIIYEDSNSISAKIDLAKEYGLGGISIWSLYNVPDYSDSKSIKFHLDGWTTILNKMKNYNEESSANIEYVNFTDDVVEETVRKKLLKETGKISIADLQGIYRLKLPKGVKSLKDLKYFTNLEYLDASQLGIEDIKAIEGLKNIRVLYIQRNNISDISFLKKQKKLEVLSLNGNQIVSISSLASLTKLKKLYLRENKIENLSPLEKFSDLVVLEVGMNNIEKVNTIKNLKNLRQLGLEYNKITDISPLKGLYKLKELYLGGNQIMDYKPVKKIYTNPEFKCDFIL